MFSLPRRVLLGALGRSWAALGRPWAALGRSWEALGRLLAALGPLLEQHAKIIKKSMPKMTDLGSKSPPKWLQNRTKKRSKIYAKNDAKKEPTLDRLEAVLGRSWVILEALLERKNRLKPFVLNGFVKNHVF